MQHQERKIIHIDMDAFYASVEQRDNPSLKGKPVIVGGEPDRRGVVAACSYEARKFGVHSAMSSARAYRLCPQAILLPPRFHVYQSVSDEIMRIFSGYTDCIEPLSLDEAFLDVTFNKTGERLATKIAREIKALIRSSTGLTASAGVSYNKFLAKAASDFKKPDGLTVVPPDRAQDFIAALPIGKFYGVGRVTEERMNTLGIQKGGDLLAFSLEELVRWFGKSGVFFFNIARGCDPRPVIPERERKSIGKEITLDEDTDDLGFMTDVIVHLSRRVSRCMKEEDLFGQTVTLKVKYYDFQSITRSLTLRDPFQDADTIARQALVLLKDTGAGEKKVRLLGVSVSRFPEREPGLVRYIQLLLPFDKA